METKQPVDLDSIQDTSLYDVSQVAKLIGRDEKFVRGLERRRVIRRASGLGRRILFLGEEVRRFIDTMRGSTASKSRNQPRNGETR